MRFPSKIRKREDSSAVSAVNVESPLPHRHHQPHANQQYHQNLQIQNNNNKTNGDAVQQQQNNSPWVFPPLPPQPNIYHHQVSTQ